MEQREVERTAQKEERLGRKGNSRGENMELVEAVVDSGSVTTIANKGAAKAFELVETWASKKGLSWTAANGSEINNYGKRR